MQTEAADIDRRALARAVSAAYGVRVRALAFLPKGEDAWAYRARCADGPPLFLRVQAAEREAGLEEAYGVVHALHDRCGLMEAVPAVRALGGSLVVPYERYVVAAFPYIAGETLYRRGAAVGDIADAAALLARLHSCDVPEGPATGFTHPFRAPVMAALRAAEQNDAPRLEAARQARALLDAERRDVLATLDMVEALAARLNAQPGERALTHGDPNLDNLLRGEDGALSLTDWGEVAVGPVERDLSAFVGPWFGTFLAAYARGRGPCHLRLDAFRFYLYRWALQEIADYSTRLLFDRVAEREAEHAWRELQPYLPVPHAAIARTVEEVARVLSVEC